MWESDVTARAALRVDGMPLHGEYEPSPWDWSREQADKYAESGGAEAADMKGKPIILLTTVGAKTGKLRKTPLMRVKDGDNYILVGSVGGAPKNPVWVYNLRANRLVEIRDLQDVRPMRVREVPEGEERSRLWALAVEVFPAYGNYQTRTERLIPVFLAEPV